MNLASDLKLAIRVLRKAPGFSLAALVVLALGIGANTAIFSIVNGVLLRPLPFAEPDRLVQLWHTPPQKSFPGMSLFSLSAANYLDWEQQNHVFDGSAIYSFTQMPGGDAAAGRLVLVAIAISLVALVAAEWLARRAGTRFHGE